MKWPVLFLVSWFVMLGLCIYCELRREAYERGADAWHRLATDYERLASDALKTCKVRR